MSSNEESDKIVQTKDCPMPRRTCPMETVDFIIWKENVIQSITRLKERLEDDQKSRHERNAAIAEVIDTERGERMLMETRISDYNKSLTERISSMAKMQEELLGVIKGSWANPKGMISRTDAIEDHLEDMGNAINKTLEKNKKELKEDLEKFSSTFDTRIKNLEEKHTRYKGFVGGILFFGSLIGALIGFIASLLGFMGK